MCKGEIAHPSGRYCTLHECEKIDCHNKKANPTKHGQPQHCVIHQGRCELPHCRNMKHHGEMYCMDTVVWCQDAKTTGLGLPAPAWLPQKRAQSTKGNVALHQIAIISGTTWTTLGMGKSSKRKKKKKTGRTDGRR